MCLYHSFGTDIHVSDSFSKYEAILPCLEFRQNCESHNGSRFIVMTRFNISKIIDIQGWDPIQEMHVEIRETERELVKKCTYRMFYFHK